MTTIGVDGQLLAQATRLNASANGPEVVELALHEFLARHPGHPFLALVGQDLVDRPYDVRFLGAGMDHGLA